MIRSKMSLIPVFLVIALGAALVSAEGQAKGKAVQAAAANQSKSTNKVCVDQTMTSPQAKPGDQVCCPVMGTKFTVKDKSPYAEINGKKVYVCCQGCVAPLTADPAKYLSKKDQKAKGCCR